MYTITKDTYGVVLICQGCAHIERIAGFNESLGSRRTQAARAMQIHARAAHGAVSVLRPLPKNYGVMGQS